MKIVNKEKFVKSILIVVMITIALLFVLVNKSLSREDVLIKNISVSEGDTLWSIARFEQENNEYYENKDVREIVYEIKKLNGLESNSNLYAGQKLIVNEI